MENSKFIWEKFSPTRSDFFFNFPAPLFINNWKWNRFSMNFLFSYLLIVDEGILKLHTFVAAVERWKISTFLHPVDIEVFKGAIQHKKIGKKNFSRNRTIFRLSSAFFFLHSWILNEVQISSIVDDFPINFHCMMKCGEQFFINSNVRKLFFNYFFSLCSISFHNFTLVNAEKLAKWVFPLQYDCDRENSSLTEVEFRVFETFVGLENEKKSFSSQPLNRLNFFFAKTNVEKNLIKFAPQNFTL